MIGAKTRPPGKGKPRRVSFVSGFIFNLGVLWIGASTPKMHSQVSLLPAQSNAPDSQNTEDLINRQVHVGLRKANFFWIYRYATRLQLCGLFLSALCAVAAGAAMPLMTVSPSSCKYHIKRKRKKKSITRLPGRGGGGDRENKTTLTTSTRGAWAPET